MSEKIYRVQMNSKGMPNFSTAEEVDAVSEWIPCSERLPSESGRYLCTCAEIQCGEYISCVDFGSFINGEWYTSGVIAWMPLPKPYGREGSE